jgi:hypothetical protein
MGCSAESKSKDYDEVYNIALESGQRFRNTAKGYGIRSGNSIPDYVSQASFIGMIDAVNEIRRIERANQGNCCG